MSNCPQCKTKNPPGATACAGCGVAFQPHVATAQPHWHGMYIAAMILGIVFFVIGISICAAPWVYVNTETWITVNNQPHLKTSVRIAWQKTKISGDCGPVCGSYNTKDSLTDKQKGVIGVGYGVSVLGTILCVLPVAAGVLAGMGKLRRPQAKHAIIVSFLVIGLVWLAASLQFTRFKINPGGGVLIGPDGSPPSSTSSGSSTSCLSTTAGEGAFSGTRICDNQITQWGPFGGWWVALITSIISLVLSCSICCCFRAQPKTVIVAAVPVVAMQPVQGVPQQAYNQQPPLAPAP